MPHYALMTKLYGKICRYLSKMLGKITFPTYILGEKTYFTNCQIVPVGYTHCHGKRKLNIPASRKMQHIKVEVQLMPKYLRKSPIAT